MSAKLFKSLPQFCWRNPLQKLAHDPRLSVRLLGEQQMHFVVRVNVHTVCG